MTYADPPFKTLYFINWSMHQFNNTSLSQTFRLIYALVTQCYITLDFHSGQNLQRNAMHNLHRLSINECHCSGARVFWMVSAAPIRPHFSAKVQTSQDLVQVVLVSTQESIVRFFSSVRPVLNYMHPLKKRKIFVITKQNSQS